MFRRNSCHNRGMHTSVVSVNRWGPWAAAIPLLATLVVFLPALNNGFINWDDPVYVTHNREVQHLSWNSLRSFFTRTYVASYVPLTMLSFALEHHLSGLDPQLFHATSLSLHLGCALLVTVIARRLGLGVMGMVAAGLLFGIHPLRVESVAWVAERKDVLSGLFFLGSLLAFLKHREEPRPRRYALTLVLFLLSLLAKGMAVTLPLVLVLAVWFKEGKLDRRVWRQVTPFAVVAVLAASGIFLSQRQAEAVAMQPGLNSFHYFFVACRGFLFYLLKTLIPWPLSALYPYPSLAGGPLNWTFWLAPVGLALVGSLVLWGARFGRAVLFGCGVFTVILLPVLQLVPIGHAVAADRYTYLPSLGLAILAGWALEKIPRRPVALVILAACGVLWGGLTWQRCFIFRDSVTLWSDVLRHYPRAALALNLRGSAFLDRGEVKLAGEDFQRALDVEPDFPEALINRGQVLKEADNDDAALADFSRAIALDPKISAGWINRAGILLERGEIRAAIADLDVFLKLEPAVGPGWQMRGTAWSRLGDLDRALADLERALVLDPGDFEAFHQRGLIRSQKKEFAAAEADQTRALELNARHANARYQRAVARFRQGNIQGAREDVRVLQTQGVPVNPRFLEALK